MDNDYQTQDILEHGPIIAGDPDNDVLISLQINGNMLIRWEGDHYGYYENAGGLMLDPDLTDIETITKEAETFMEDREEPK